MTILVIMTQPPGSGPQSNSLRIPSFDGMTGIELFNCRGNKKNGFPIIPGRRGFTLLEVMIALSILAIALTAVFLNQSQSISMECRTRFLTTASLLAQAKMAEIEATDLSNMNARQGDFGEDFPEYEWRISVADTEIALIRKVTLDVSNARMSSNNHYRVILYRPDRN